MRLDIRIYAQISQGWRLSLRASSNIELTYKLLSLSKSTARESALLESIFSIFLSSSLGDPYLAWEEGRRQEMRQCYLDTNALQSSPAELWMVLLCRPLRITIAGPVWHLAMWMCLYLFFCIFHFNPRSFLWPSLPCIVLPGSYFLQILSRGFSYSWSLTSSWIWSIGDQWEDKRMDKSKFLLPLPPIMSPMATGPTTWSFFSVSDLSGFLEHYFLPFFLQHYLWWWFPMIEVSECLIILCLFP